MKREGTPARLALALMKLLEQFSFRDQITRPIRSAIEDEELPQAMLNYNSLEALRRAFVAAIKSIEIALQTIAAAATAAQSTLTQVSDTLATFIEEVRRALGSQSQVYGAGRSRRLARARSNRCSWPAFSRGVHRRIGRRRFSLARLARLDLSARRARALEAIRSDARRHLAGDAAERRTLFLPGRLPRHRASVSQPAAAAGGRFRNRRLLLH